MPKYHNGANGPEECEATVRPCPLTNYDTKEEAQAAYDNIMDDKQEGDGKMRRSTSCFATMNAEQQQQILSLIPRVNEKDASYYAATDKKHFTDRQGAGSKYLASDLNKIEDVLALAIKQRGSLDGDDREKFKALGNPDSSFADGIRYLMVETPGTVGIKNTDTMPDDQPLEVIRTKPELPCTFVLPVESQPKTHYGVIIIGPDPEEPHKERLWTTFPGSLTPVPKGQKNEEVESHEGGNMTVGDARRIRGGDFFVNTRLIQK